MKHLAKLAILLTLVLAACEVPEEAVSGAKPLPKVYRIDSASKATVQFRMLDAINSLRAVGNLEPVVLNARLNAAAATHSRDMSLQNRPWHFGSDGSSPLDRVERVGYEGLFLSENISETYETELETLSAWMSSEATRDIILDPRANEIGFAWHQDPSGKIWWTLIMGQAQPTEDETADASTE